MNFAEGKGPKQVKKQWPLGQFVTIYGNGDPAVNLNPADPPYPQTFTASGNNINGVVYPSGTGSQYAIPGSLIPGLNLNVNGNSATDVSFICSPSSNESIQDIESTVVNLTAETTWSGTCNVVLQGTMNRYVGTTDYTSTNWVDIVSGSVTTANVPVQLSIPVASGILYNAYRLIASGGTGIIDWTIGGMFVDLSANRIGDNAADTNGNIGQMSIQMPRNIAISGNVTTVNETDSPYENYKANHTWVG